MRNVGKLSAKFSSNQANMLVQHRALLLDEARWAPFKTVLDDVGWS